MIASPQRDRRDARALPASHTQGIATLDAYFRAANYLAAAQLYLRDNVLLDLPLTSGHIKPRILGHWGTQPGINLIYTHLNRLISDTGAQVMLVVGPEHGAPAVLSNLYLEETLHAFEPTLTQDRAGMTRFIRRFSWPYGAPSHVTAGTPGAIHEGGELGYSLSHAFGAAFDQPDLIVACIVGDGEAETAPLAAAWQSNKFLNPATSGAVLPIVHLNGVKLSAPTIFGAMSANELGSYFRGLGYDPYFVTIAGDDAPHEELVATFDRAYAAIRGIQLRARMTGLATPPEWPVVILHSLKGMTGPQVLDGERIEGTFRSLGLPIADPATNPGHLVALEAWLRSYRPQDLFEDGVPRPHVLAALPSRELRMGCNRIANHRTERAAGRVVIPKSRGLGTKNRGPSENVLLRRSL